MEKYIPSEISTAAAVLGRKGGASKSPAKTAAVRENGRRGGRKSALRRACENHYGYVDATPGTDITSRLDCSKSTIAKYVKLGWIEKRGAGLVLTALGYGNMNE